MSIASDSDLYDMPVECEGCVFVSVMKTILLPFVIWLKESILCVLCRVFRGGCYVRVRRVVALFKCQTHKKVYIN